MVCLFFFLHEIVMFCHEIRLWKTFIWHISETNLMAKKYICVGELVTYFDTLVSV